MMSYIYGPEVDEKVSCSLEISEMSAPFVKVLGLFIVCLWSVKPTTARGHRCPLYLTPNAVMAHPSDNTKYLKCDDTGYLIESMCPVGATFNVHRLVCVTLAKIDASGNPPTNPCPCPTTTMCPCPPETTTTKCPCPTTSTPCPTTTTPGQTTTTPTPPVSSTTPCVSCEYGQPGTSLPPIVTTAPPKDECYYGKVDVPRPVVTTPPPVECK